MEPEKQNKKEHIRRLGEVSYLLLDAGLITVISARELSGKEVANIDDLTLGHETLLVSLGDFEGQYSNHIPLEANPDETHALTEVFTWLEERGFYFSP